MDVFVTGSAIRRLRKARGLTQQALAERIGVSGKTVSKWETAKGLPDISLLEPLAAALAVSVAELMQGQAVANQNMGSNLLRSKLYVCPRCGNIIHSTGEVPVTCCGGLLPALKAAPMDEAHGLTVEKVENERFVSIKHEMTKTHFISFMAYVTADVFLLKKLYPEGRRRHVSPSLDVGCCMFTAIGTG